MPRADPTVKRDTAIRHLFRHLGDESELVRNPLVGPDLLTGRLTLSELRGRVANAAVTIAEDDSTAGKAERGRRQAACLLRCDLGHESVAELAAAFALSPRQMARDRLQAWIRCVPHIVPRASREVADCSVSLLNTRLVALFRGGRANEGAQLVLRYGATLSPEQIMLSICHLSMLQYVHRDYASASENLRKAQNLLSKIPSEERSTRGLSYFAMNLLCRLVEEELDVSVSRTDITALARQAALEIHTTSWMSQLVVRLLLSLGEKYSASRNWRCLEQIADALDQFISFVDLDSNDYGSLYNIKSDNEWNARGFNLVTESNGNNLVHLALAEGWIDVALVTAAGLAAMYSISGDSEEARKYRDIALAATTLCESRRVLFHTHESLAVAALDTGSYAEARTFIDMCHSSGWQSDLEFYDLQILEAELMIRRGDVDRGMRQARNLARRGEDRNDTRWVCGATRIVALGFQAAGNLANARFAIDRALALAAADSPWYPTQLIRTASNRIAMLGA